MRFFTLGLFVAYVMALALLGHGATRNEISILWKNAPASGHITIDRGAIQSLAATGATIRENAFTQSTAKRLELTISPTSEPNALPILVTVSGLPRGFTFRLEDVDANYPIYLPDDGAIVTEANDLRSYTEIEKAIQSRGGQTKLQKIKTAPDTSFDVAAVTGRDHKVQTWLGVSRDMRIFRIDEHLETFQPKFAGYDVPLPETPKQTATYAFQFGRGWGANDNVTRRLDDGVLPILHGEILDDAITYDVTMFASLEKSPLTRDTLRGTDYLVADAHGHGHMFTPAQAEAQQQRREGELNSPEEVVLYVRAVAKNTSQTPAYAIFKTATPFLATQISPRLPAWKFDWTTGFGSFESGRVFAVSKLNGSPLQAEETSVLLRPGASVVIDIAVPHRPLPPERATALATQNFDQRLGEARAFWKAKLAEAAQIKLPESRIQAMIHAGLLHLDVVGYGREPNGPIVPAIGIYTAIGSESAPIIQFMDSMGWHDQAARAIDFFLQKQHESGFIQNFNGYMLETGAVLWTMGEHYRYTRDDVWLQRVHPHATKAWQYLRDWRRRNVQPELKQNGYGMLDGKTADPDDPFRSFMLNGYAYLGLIRTAEMLAKLSPAEAAECRAEAEMLKHDILESYDALLARSPVVPLGDGRWMRAAPPWTNYRGPVMLHADGGKWFTHWTMTSRDSLLGPLYLVFQEVIAPRDQRASELLEVNSELFLRNNVAFSQPYYSRHPWLHLQRNEPEAFLQAWYGSVAALADRETYTFNEHFTPVSAHKTHEEAWFLMETRWMLYLEDGDTLRLFAGAPRAYFKSGATISVERAASYFGALSFKTQVSPDGRSIKVTVDCPGDRRPTRVSIRVPHPLHSKPVTVEGGVYDITTETVLVDNFAGRAEVTLRY